MLLTLRKFLIIFLTILQLFAPLVHAHASDSHSNQGFHVPGLEDFSSQHDSLAYLKAPAFHTCVDGVLVSVGLGLKQKENPAIVNNNCYIVQQIPSLAKPNLVSKSYDSTLDQSLLLALVTSSPPTRAPPRL
jgi:hypothetical protein